MSEHDWVTSGNPEAMLEMAAGVASERRMRLFVCAAARAYWPMLEGHPEFVGGIEAAERYVDGLADVEALLRVHEQVFAVRGAITHRHTRAVAYACSPLAGAVDRVVRQLCELPPRGLTIAGLADLLREVFPNPFRQPALAADVLAWQGGTVGKLAQAAYDERRLPAGTLDPARIAVLADALEEVGCADDAVTSHLRSAGPHVRGCWVIDLILGEE